MRVIVTGSSGRLGGAIVRRLHPTHAVIGLDLKPSPTTSHVGDIGDMAFLSRFLDRADAVIHCAALHAPHVGAVPEARFWDVNVEVTQRLAEEAQRAGIGPFIFTSTTALYGAGKADGPCQWLDEDSPGRPQTVYHRTKQVAELRLQALAQPGFRVTILRVGRCFPEAVNRMALYRLHRGLDAEDVAAAHLRALLPSKEVCRTFVLSGPTPFRREDCDLLRADAAAAVRLRAPSVAEAFDRLGWPLPRSIDRVYSPARAMAGLGWRPERDALFLLRQWRRNEAEALPPDPV